MNTLKTITLFLLKKYDCIVVNDVALTKSSVVIDAYCCCQKDQTLKKYKNRLSALIHALIYSMNHKTELVGLCFECGEEMSKKYN